MKKVFTVFAALCAVCMLSAYENAAEALKAASELRNKRDFKGAAAVYEEAGKLATQPGQKYSAVFLRGVCLCQAGSYDDGISLIREARRIAASNGQKISSQFHIGYYLSAQKKYDEAIAEMKKVKEIAPGVKNDYVDRVDSCIGLYLSSQKKYKEAVEAVQESCKSPNPDIALTAWSVAYTAYRNLKDDEGMQKAVSAMLALEPRQASLYFTARRCAFELARAQKKHAEALKYADEIVAKKGLNKFLHDNGVFYKAISYAALRDKENELAQWKLLENCGIKSFEAAAARNIKRLTEKK
ncbi:MAG: tetratricopeptide repeat protein [Lentisphaeria bacterium]|nr:tetratricopeptide repeat protein [Lentisphaeria bacterium]